MEIQVSITLAASLVDRSERTVGRWLDRKTGEKVSLDRLVEVAKANDSQLVIPLDGPEDLAMLLKVDEGLRARGHETAAAFTDLALAFLQAGAHAPAVSWLTRAADDSPEAMHWLGRCYLEGLGVAADYDTGMMWLHKAAAAGHIISKAQTAAQRAKITAPDRAASR
jgi:hypothetical protein